MVCFVYHMHCKLVVFYKFDPLPLKVGMQNSYLVVLKVENVLNVEFQNLGCDKRKVVF